MKQLVFTFGLLLCCGVAFGQKEEKPQALPKPIEALVKKTRESVVVVSFKGRDGNQQGVGSGFVVDPNGLIATNLHVIGEARPINVQLADGKMFDVEEVHASERGLDLALIRIKAKGLKALPLGDSSKIEQGQQVVALGNPHGLKHSVVSGVVSAKRMIDGRPMLQVAIPVEPGNSGGPVMDMNGRVVGIMTMKSAVTRNLGFAVEVNALKPLIAKPNPVPMNKWLTIGTLDPSQWKPVMDARWRQRAGRIFVEGMGSGFGGRAICVWQKKPPKRPYEIAVSVKLDDEKGAAGLIFESDGGDLHYGFYPTGGSLRLTRFDGPNVFTWKIIETLKSEHYRPGEFNTIKVRLEKEGMKCFVNDEMVIESNDKALAAGRVGLCKFRQTEAEFKGFRVADSIPPSRVAPKVIERITKKVEDLPASGELDGKLVDALKNDASAAAKVLARRARELEEQAVQLRKLAAAVHTKRVTTEIAAEFKKKDEAVDLFRVALLIAKLDNAELEPENYESELQRMASAIGKRIAKDADENARLDLLHQYLFRENGYHGSRTDYYNQSNSYINEVIDDREGLPITLSLLYMELGRRIGLKIDGVGTPGHFIVRASLAKKKVVYVDVFDGGTKLDRDGVVELIQKLTGRVIGDEALKVSTKSQIAIRMLHNLLGLAQRAGNIDRALGYLDAIIAIAGDASFERWMRAVLRAQSGRRKAAMEDTSWLMERHPPDVDMNRVEQLHRALEHQR